MDWGAQRYERLVQEDGLSPTHRQVLAWVPEGSRVLELGCATGFLGTLLVQSKRCQVVGVEIDAAAARIAEQRGLSVLVGSLEDAELRRTIAGPFDVVLATDVLEHLRDPEAILHDMKGWLRPDGRAIVSVPNIAVWSMRVAMFMHGAFEYQDTGILDHTHLRFYTWETFQALVRKHGWGVEAAFANAWQLPGTLKVLEQWPASVRARAQRLTAAGGWRAKLGPPVDGLATRVMLARDRWAARLGARRPNLCATHIALLLRPA
jgi:methionine biosynthesis protein MetW